MIWMEIKSHIESSWIQFFSLFSSHPILDMRFKRAAADAFNGSLSPSLSLSVLITDSSHIRFMYSILLFSNFYCIIFGISFLLLLNDFDLIHSNATVPLPFSSFFFGRKTPLVRQLLLLINYAKKCYPSSPSPCSIIIAIIITYLLLFSTPPRPFIQKVLFLPILPFLFLSCAACPLLPSHLQLNHNL